MRRPAEGEREVLAEGVLDLTEGLVGDMWSARGSKRTPDGSAHPDMQLTLMSARVVDLVAASDRERWTLAGDQLYVDFDISVANLPPGTRLALGSAVIEVTARAAHRLRQVRRALRRRRAPLREHEAASAPAPAWPERQGRRARHGLGAATRSASSDAPGRSPPRHQPREAAPRRDGRAARPARGARLRRRAHAPAERQRPPLEPAPAEAARGEAGAAACARVSGSRCGCSCGRAPSWPRSSAATRSGRWSTNPSRYLVSFLSKRLPAKVARELEAAEIAPAQLVIDGRELYAWYPDGIQRAPLAKLLDDKRLGVVSTARNWNTVTKLLAAARRLGSRPCARGG